MTLSSALAATGDEAAALAQAIRHVWGFAQRTCSPGSLPGLYKHRSVEAAMAQQEAWDAPNFAAFLARRRDSDQ